MEKCLFKRGVFVVFKTQHIIKRQNSSGISIQIIFTRTRENNEKQSYFKIGNHVLNYGNAYPKKHMTLRWRCQDVITSQDVITTFCAGWVSYNVTRE